MAKSVPASIAEVAFDCLHCGSYTTHTWYQLWGTALLGDSRTPSIVDAASIERVRENTNLRQDMRDFVTSHFEQLLSGLVLVEQLTNSKYVGYSVENLHLSKCFACEKVSVWVYDKPVFPVASDGPPPNPDLPNGARLDYEEAGRILNLSPRAAAALLRLTIQKLCVHLGEKGKDLNEDIGNLVKKGLSPVVQKSLDAVRVVGNEAVHPGALDLKDDRETATTLCKLVNIVAEQMISNPKHVDEIYARLPEGKRQAIEKRDTGTSS